MNICDFDNPLFRWVNGFVGKTDTFDHVGVFFATSVIYLMAASVILLAWYHYVTAHTRKSRHEAVRDIAMMLRAAAASLGAILANFLFSLLYFRERPFVALEQVTRLINEPLTTKSLPSDHTSMAFAIAVSVTYLHPRFGAVMLFLAAGVGVSRVFVGVHYPSDVLAGVFVGFIAATLVRYLGNRWRDMDFIDEELKMIRKFRKKKKRR